MNTWSYPLAEPRITTESSFVNSFTPTITGDSYVVFISGFLLYLTNEYIPKDIRRTPRTIKIVPTILEILS